MENPVPNPLSKQSLPKILQLGSLGGEYGLLGIGGAGGEISPPKLVTAPGRELIDDASIVEPTWKSEECDR